jgi:predicted nucleotidyltransferase
VKQSPPATIDTAVREVISRYPQVKLAILFGSSAKGTDTADSDLDISVLTDGPLASDLKIQIIGDLASRFERPVDLIDLRTAGEPLLGQVLKGRRILGDDTTYARLITRHLFDAADLLPYRNRILAERRARWIDS